MQRCVVVSGLGGVIYHWLRPQRFTTSTTTWYLESAVSFTLSARAVGFCSSTSRSSGKEQSRQWWQLELVVCTYSPAETRYIGQQCPMQWHEPFAAIHIVVCTMASVRARTNLGHTGSRGWYWDSGQGFAGARLEQLAIGEPSGTGQ